MIGRTAEAARVREALATHRAVQILGPPGIGKTTVARAVLPDAVRVGLEPIAPGSLLAAVAEALDVPAEPDALIGALSTREALVLDGAEDHTEAVGTLVARLLQGCPTLVVLTTTRLRVPGLPVLELGPLPTADGVTLFRERARTLSPLLDGDELGDDVHALVAHLGGWPLALDLAASRMRVFTPAELLDELTLDLLRDPRRADRHASLEGALEVSVRALEPGERLALSRIAQIRRRFGARAFAEVTEAGPAVLEHLVDASLVRRLPEGERFELLQPVRTFALDRLPPSDPGRERYVRAVLERGEAAAARVNASDGRRARARIQELAPDLEGLLEGPPDVGVRASLVLAELAVSHAPPVTALDWLARPDRQRASPDLLDASLRMEAHIRLRDGQLDAVRALIARLPADLETARMEGVCLLRERRVDEALAVFQRLLEALGDDGDALARAEAWMAMAATLQAAGRGQDAVRAGESGLRAMAGGPDRSDVAGSLHHYLGLALRGTGDMEGAHAHLVQAADLCASVGHLRRHVGAQSLLALLEADLGLARAEDRATEVLAEARRLGDAFIVVRTELLRGQLVLEAAARTGDRAGMERARELLAATPPGSHLAEAARALTLGVAAHLLGDADALAWLDRASFPGRTADAHLHACFRAVAAGERAPDPPPDGDQPLRIATEVARAGPDLPDALAAACDASLDLRLLRAMVRLPAGLEVAESGSWFRGTDGQRVDLARKRVLRRMLHALAAAGGRPVPVVELREAAWPGERMTDASARNRLHVAIAELRKLGLRDAVRLAPAEDGPAYALHARVRPDG